MVTFVTIKSVFYHLVFGVFRIIQVLSIFEELLVFQLHDPFPLHVELELLHFYDLDQLIFLQTVQLLDHAQTLHLVFGIEQFFVSLVVFTV